MKNTVYTVKQLNGEIRNLVESSYPSLWVEGEISGLATPKSGHLYFSLREDDSIIRCAFFRNRQIGGGTVPKEGMQVLVRGQISYYEPRGDLQFIVHHLEDAGEGALRRAFEALKKKLDSEGLFANIHKKAIPKFPACIGVVTSDSGAALHDVLVTLKRRFALCRVIIYPTLVQGEKAPESILNALDQAESRAETNVILLVRGGGSLEDLQAFNDERVARKIFQCTIPVVTGIGHEIDFTISDFVADFRAATPTAAAESVSPSSSELLASLTSLGELLARQTLMSINHRQQTVDLMQSGLIHPGQRMEKYLAEHAFLERALLTAVKNHIEGKSYLHQFSAKSVASNSPRARLKLIKQQVTSNQGAIVLQTQTRLNSLSQLLSNLTGKIKLMNPQHTLDRGYAIVQNKSKSVITGPDEVQLGENLEVTVSRGNISVTVNKN